MSSSPVVVTEGLSKRYRLGAGRDPYPSLRDKIASVATAPIRKVSRRSRAAAGTEFWALKDLSIEIQQGEIVGFIGRNGAGKTTLLKILSRITDPTEGWAELRGRVGSLLEVGTGFHPELTGRENIGLNGAILGMSRAEIRRRFDEIVEFSEIARFLDTPVKRYSSGMYVRLAFAVAAHLEPEILIVDEVLAVGDAAFQQKCLAKMGSIAQEGRTVLFVSHNMAVIETLCDRGVMIEQGMVVADGPVNDTVTRYLASLERSASQELLDRADRDPRGWRRIMLKEVEVVSPGGGAPSTGRPARFIFRLNGTVSAMECSFTIYDDLGLPVATLDSSVHSAADDASCAEAAFVCEVDELPLVPGQYRLDVVLTASGHIEDGLESAGRFQVEEGTMRGRPVPIKNVMGHVFPPHRWQVPGNGAGARPGA